jgi:hypothetical protein
MHDNLPTPSTTSEPSDNEDEGNHEEAPLHQPSLLMEDDVGNDHPQLPWDHHNGDMLPLTQEPRLM